MIRPNDYHNIVCHSNSVLAEWISLLTTKINNLLFRIALKLLLNKNTLKKTHLQKSVPHNNIKKRLLYVMEWNRNRQHFGTSK